VKALARSALSTLARLAITGFAFWWVLRLVDLAALRRLLTSANPTWLGMTVAVFGVAQLGCITRWWVLVPRHPALTWPFLANSFFVSQLFSFILPTTVGGDVVRGYDLIKATGEWKAPLASILGDRLVGFLGFMVSALIAWLCSPAAFPFGRTARPWRRGGGPGTPVRGTRRPSPGSLCRCGAWRRGR